MVAYKNSLEFAKEKDKKDPLNPYRSKFHIPVINGIETIYFTGNSLGLQPKSTKEYIDKELEAWKNWGVEGHFEAEKPWFSYHEFLTEKAAKIVGAQPLEVVITHSLTTNLHLLMASFYQPTETRYKIICEKKAFPSDQYALESQAKFHGRKPEEAIIEVGPREGEHLIHEEDIIAAINEAGESLAMVMIGGVNYYTGQLFDMEKITKAGHNVGAFVGFDLAHAAGNVKLELHKWGVDFAAWCSYKYLNSSPGGVSGLFVHEKHAHNKELPRFAGWWGHDKETRFLMEPGFQPIPGAEGWQLSNAPVLGMAAHLASLDIFDEVGMDALIEKRKDLTNYLEFLINDISDRLGDACTFEIITPKNETQRGAQLSILAHGMGKPLFDAITKMGVIADWREPNVIRIAPVPLYNSFEDVYRFSECLEKAINQ
ncbi:kynureninase [Crocinitomix algicola]|uniref:kynureninase n=1 Tax=Crocinitomix algicola TaxID=1740263 RepID=UPI0008348D15|nr:kynureninase [Crocinitomix algicola]